MIKCNRLKKENYNYCNPVRQPIYTNEIIKQLQKENKNYAVGGVPSRRQPKTNETPHKLFAMTGSFTFLYNRSPVTDFYAVILSQPKKQSDSSKRNHYLFNDFLWSLGDVFDINVNDKYFKQKTRHVLNILKQQLAFKQQLIKETGEQNK